MRARCHKSNGHTDTRHVSQREAVVEQGVAAQTTVRDAQRHVPRRILPPGMLVDMIHRMQQQKHAWQTPLYGRQNACAAFGIRRHVRTGSKPVPTRRCVCFACIQVSGSNGRGQWGARNCSSPPLPTLQLYSTLRATQTATCRIKRKGSRAWAFTGAGGVHRPRARCSEHVPPHTASTPPTAHSTTFYTHEP